MLPFLCKSAVRSARYRPVYKMMVIMFFVDVIVLGYCGHSAPTATLKVVGQIATAYYFLFFLALPLLAKFEKTKPVPEGI